MTNFNYAVTVSSVDNQNDQVKVVVSALTCEEAIGKAMQQAGHWYTDVVTCVRTTALPLMKVEECNESTSYNGEFEQMQEHLNKMFWKRAMRVCAPKA